VPGERALLRLAALEQLARLPALDERQPARVVDALVGRVEDAALLAVGGVDERLERLDLQESVDFYIDLLGAEPIPTPNFGIPVQWMALGRTQLHLFERDLTPTSHHHLGITVDNVEPV
jgi:hypothetical protein